MSNQDADDDDDDGERDTQTLQLATKRKREKRNVKNEKNHRFFSPGYKEIHTTVTFIRPLYDERTHTRQ